MKKSKYMILIVTITLLILSGCKNKENHAQPTNMENKSTEKDTSVTSSSNSSTPDVSTSETAESNTNTEFSEKDALEVANKVVDNFIELLSGEWEGGSGDNTVTMNFAEGKLTVKEVSGYDIYSTEGTYSINTNKIAGTLLDLSEISKENKKRISELKTYKEYTDLFQSEYNEEREKGITVNIKYKTTRTSTLNSDTKELTGDNASIIYINNFKMKILDGSFLKGNLVGKEYSKK